ncbi:MAG: hypothetical protein ABIT37_01700 [Luteolibacter sp.]
MPSPLQLAAAAHLNREADARSRKYPVPTQGTLIERRLDRFKRADAKVFRTLMKPENADQVIDAMPVGEGEALHSLLCGDFVFCDLILRMVTRFGAPLSLVITTLSLSMKNLVGIEAMFAEFPNFPLHLVVSSYFQSTNKKIFVALETLVAKFPDRFTITIGRSHAKLVLLDYGQEAGCFVIETSSNLRSSNCLEQVSVFRERALFDFHLGWVEAFRATKAEE